MNALKSKIPNFKNKLKELDKSIQTELKNKENRKQS
jgi:hypothetical protein